MQRDMFSLLELLKAPRLPPVTILIAAQCYPIVCGVKCSLHRTACHLNNALITFSEIHDMPRPKAVAKPSFVPTTFIRCELTAEERKEFIAFADNARDDVDTLVVEILQSNHKIGFSFSDHNDSFICSVTGRPEECINANKCYTSHAKDYQTALMVALFKFHIVWQRGVWEEGASDISFG